MNHFLNIITNDKAEKNLSRCLASFISSQLAVVTYLEIGISLGNFLLPNLWISYKIQRSNFIFLD